MRKRKTLTILGVIVGGVCLLLGLSYYQLLLRPQPKTSGAVSVPGLAEQVEVYRDSCGVPHIFARNEQDLFLAQGYVEAQDRLWQMDLSRRMATGRLSEIFGEETVEADKFIRTLGIGRIGEELAENLSPEAFTVLRSYCEGVNSFISQNRKSLPVEFRVLHYEPEPWEPSHSLAYLRLLGWMLSFAWESETAMGKLVETVGEEKAREAFPSYPLGAPYIVHSLARLLPALSGQKGLRNQAAVGSNSWVLSGSRSATGKPVLASDPHLRLVVPSPWYEVHLKGGEYNVAGFSFPGLPLVVIGRNVAIAWGLTNLMADDVDFYVEKLNPEDPEQYLFKGRWEEMGWRIEEINVRGKGRETIEVRSTVHGPVVSDLMNGGGEAISMRWTGFERTCEPEAFVGINKASNWQEFKEALRQFGLPAQNFVYADTAGNIGYWAAGTIPLRSEEQALLPVPGWTGENEWKGFVRFEELPHLFNPKEGYIVTANNRVVGDEYPHYISRFWEPPWRAVRITELLVRKTRLSVDNMKEMQADWLSTQARENLPKILAALRGRALSDTARMALEFLSSWDFLMSPESVPACIYEVFYTKLMRNTFADEMGSELYHAYTSVPNLPIGVMDRMIASGKSSWFDDVNTSGREGLADILCRSLEETVEFLSHRLGEEPFTWRWGDLHTVRLEHPLGKPRLLKRLLNIAPAPAGGSFATVNLGGHPVLDPSSCFFAPTARLIVDLSDMDNSLSVLPPGQSGHPRSPHYRDQLEPWLRGDYHTSRLDERRIVASAVGELMLIPAKRR